MLHLEWKLVVQLQDHSTETTGGCYGNNLLHFYSKRFLAQSRPTAINMLEKHCANTCLSSDMNVFLFFEIFLFILKSVGCCLLSS